MAEVKQQTYAKAVVLEAFKRVERDFLAVYLDDKKKYTVEQARKILNDKLKGAVK